VASHKVIQFALVIHGFAIHGFDLTICRQFIFVFVVASVVVASVVVVAYVVVIAYVVVVVVDVVVVASVVVVHFGLIVNKKYV